MTTKIRTSNLSDPIEINVSGGAIDGTVIGGTTPAAISGTTGSFSGDLTVDTDTLFVDASTNRVGIGTSSPDYTLDVLSNSGFSWEVARIRNDTAGDGALLRFVHADSPSAGYDIGPTGGTDGFAFRRDGSEQMRIDSEGVVSINEGTVVLNGNEINALQVTIADDAVAELSFPTRTGGFLFISTQAQGSFPQKQYSYGGLVDFGNTPAFNTAFEIGSQTEFDSNNTLTGTTGTDGKLTVGLAGTSGILYIENRTGDTRSFQITLL